MAPAHCPNSAAAAATTSSWGTSRRCWEMFQRCPKGSSIWPWRSPQNVSGERLTHRRAGRHRLREHGLGVGDLERQHHRRAADRGRREHPHLGELVGDVQHVRRRCAAAPTSAGRPASGSVPAPLRRTPRGRSQPHGRVPHHDVRRDSGHVRKGSTSTKVEVKRGYGRAAHGRRRLPAADQRPQPRRPAATAVPRLGPAPRTRHLVRHTGGVVERSPVRRDVRRVHVIHATIVAMCARTTVVASARAAAAACGGRPRGRP